MHLIIFDRVNESQLIYHSLNAIGNDYEHH